MKILQQSIKVKRHSRVNIHFSRPSTIYLMTEVNFKRYKDGASFQRIGGQYEKSPVEFIAPYDGTWHAVIEKGAHVNPQPIDGRVEVLPPLMKDIPYLSSTDDASKNEAVSEEQVDASISVDQSNEDMNDDVSEDVENTGEDVGDDENNTNEDDEDESKD